MAWSSADLPAMIEKSLVEWFAWKGFGLETRSNCLEQGPDRQQDWKSCTNEVYVKAPPDLTEGQSLFLVFPCPWKKKNCLMKDMLSPSSTDLTTSWRFGANLLENQLFPEKYPLSCWNSWPWCIGLLSVKARGWALCTIFWENNTRGFHWCQEESDGLLRECTLEVSQAKLPFKPGVHRLTFLLPPPYISPCAPTCTSPAKLYIVCSIFPF